MNTIYGFVSRDDLATPGADSVAPILEMSRSSTTFSVKQEAYHYDIDPRYSLQVFNSSYPAVLTKQQSDNVLDLVSRLIDQITAGNLDEKTQNIVFFTNYFNNTVGTAQITSLDYGSVASYSGVSAPSWVKVQYTMGGVEYYAHIWLSDAEFQVGFPFYDVEIAPPVENFFNLLNSPATLYQLLGEFDFTALVDRASVLRADKNATQTLVLNVPFTVPNTSMTRECYFAFNVYGRQGLYNNVLKVKLLEALLAQSQLSREEIGEMFPELLKTNEFIVVPMWSKVAIASQVGAYGINSQLLKASESDIATLKQLAPIQYGTKTDAQVREALTYMPVDYNNLMLRVLDGPDTSEEMRVFSEVYGDYISVSSTSADFGRQKQTTQQMVTILLMLLGLADAETEAEMLDNVASVTGYEVTVVQISSGIKYVSAMIGSHRFFVLPKYVELALLDPEV